MLEFNEKYFSQLYDILIKGTADTLYMVGFSGILSIIFGLALGILLYVTAQGGILEKPKIHNIIGIIVNIGRSIPFVIIIIAVFPISKLFVGTYIGKTAAVVPLTIAAAPFVARVVESGLNELGKGIIEAALSVGASPFQIIFRVLLPESAPALISGFTITIVNLISYSAMAGTIGGGGLGDVAIRYGYQRFRTDILVLTVIILIIMVQIIQTAGRLVARKLDKR